MRIPPPSAPLWSLADQERKRYGVGGGVRTDELLRAAGHEVQIKKLRAAAGGLEACVLPLGGGRHRFVCDDDASPGEPEEVERLRTPRQFRVSFRLAHELAHTVLDSMADATSFGARSTSAIETRCDEFAALFLVGQAEARRAVDRGNPVVEALARGLDVPQYLVRIAAQLAA